MFGVVEQVFAFQNQQLSLRKKCFVAIQLL